MIINLWQSATPFRYYNTKSSRYLIRTQNEFYSRPKERAARLRMTVQKAFFLNISDVVGHQHGYIG